MKMCVIIHAQYEVVILLKNCLHLMCKLHSLWVILGLQLLHNDQFVGIKMSSKCKIRLTERLLRPSLKECLRADRLGLCSRACLTRFTFSGVRTVRLAPGGLLFISVPRAQSVLTQRRIVMRAEKT